MRHCRTESSQNPARKTDFWPGSIIEQPTVPCGPPHFDHEHRRVSSTYVDTQVKHEIIDECLTELGKGVSEDDVLFMLETLKQAAVAHGKANSDPSALQSRQASEQASEQATVDA